jgi:hypothetical protein
MWTKAAKWFDAMSPQDVADRRVGDVVTEISDGSGDLVVTPRHILPGHSQHELLNLIRQWWPSDFLSTVAVIVFGCDKDPMPPQDRVGHQTRQSDVASRTRRAQPASLRKFRKRPRWTTRRGRVGRWRGGTGFGIVLYQGFPFGASIAACHTPFPLSRSSNRTCGFPASGFPTSFTRQHTIALFHFGRDADNITIFDGE